MNRLRIQQVLNFISDRNMDVLSLNEDLKAKIQSSHQALLSLLERNEPIYGVTTGFGRSCTRGIHPGSAETLQANLVRYLQCGTGQPIERTIARTIFVCRYLSLSRGYSGVSLDLLEQMSTMLRKDIIPVVPSQGSLGASGDLVPLAYFAAALQGEGLCDRGRDGTVPMSTAFADANLKPYVFRAKEALAVVNGTSAMAGHSLINWKWATQLFELSVIATSWAILILRSPQEAYSPLVNERARNSRGQAQVASWIRILLKDEDQNEAPGSVSRPIQERYSIRCVPQILGPVWETLELVQGWLEEEINGVSDNPLIESNESWAMGGNFYGGYLSQGMDYLKISVAHIADLVDRQIMNLFDERPELQLPPNLSDWNSLTESERHLHHGLKGLHQSISAITSEIMAKAQPNGIFSRSSESHNQDKVSLGWSAAVQCYSQLNQLNDMMALSLTCLAQALDLRQVTFRHPVHRWLYDTVRSHVPKITQDQPLGKGVQALSQLLKTFVDKESVLEKI